MNMVRHEIILVHDGVSLTNTCRADSQHAARQCSVIASRVLDEKTVALTIGNTFNGACEKDFSKACMKSVANHRNIILNFSHLSHMDVEGASLLVLYASLAAQHNVSLSACGLKDPLRDVFRLTRLDEEIAVFDTVEQARQRVGFREDIVSSPGVPSTYEEFSLPGWARSVDCISVREIAADAMNINVDDRETSSPVTGFGRLGIRDTGFTFTIPHSTRFR